MLTNHRLLSPILLVVLIAFVVCVGLSTQANNNPASVSVANPTVADGLAAWSQIYSVMISPRCLNCHTATRYPQQGDDRHRHFANVIRGQEGRGVTALRCIGLSSGGQRRQHWRSGWARLAFGAAFDAMAGRE